MAEVSVVVIGGVSYFRIFGDVVFQEIADAITNNYPGITGHVLWDFTHGSVKPLNSGEIQELVKIVKTNSVNRSKRKTVFVCIDDTSYAIVQRHITQSQIANKEVTYCVFRSIEPALLWLHGLR